MRAGFLVNEVATGLRRNVTMTIAMILTTAISIGLFVVVSILTSREPFDLDRMLHRGIHADSQSGGGDERPVRWYERLGFGHEMTRWDRIITAVTIAWPIFFTLVFAVGLAWYFAAPVMQWPQISDEAWVEAWGWWLWFAIATAMVVTVWFTIGGFRDLVRMFRLMGQVQADERDDGRVIGHVNADEIEAGAAEGRTPSPTDRERKS